MRVKATRRCCSLSLCLSLSLERGAASQFSQSHKQNAQYINDHIGLLRLNVRPLQMVLMS